MTILYKRFVVVGLADQEVAADTSLTAVEGSKINLIGVIVTPHTHEDAIIYIKDKAGTPIELCDGIVHSAVDNITNMIPLDHTLMPGRTVTVSIRCGPEPRTITGCYVYTETPLK